MKELTTEQAASFIEKNPTLLGTTVGARFYEHPTRGDEAPIYALLASGVLLRTNSFDLCDAKDEVTGGL